MKYLRIFFVIACMYVASAPSAHALSCAIEPENMLERGEVIFLGKFESLHISPSMIDRVPAWPGNGEDYARFSVEKYWKGDMGAVVDVHGIYAWGMTGPFFQKKGESYIIFARTVQYGTSTRMFANIDCGSTGVASKEVEKALDALASSQQPPAVPTQPPIVQFPRNLMLGSTGNDVVMLQSFLETKGLLVMPIGISKGYFGGLTKAALVKYQTEENIVPAYGYFGPFTRAKVSASF